MDADQDDGMTIILHTVLEGSLHELQEAQHLRLALLGRGAQVVDESGNACDTWCALGHLA